MEAILKDHEDGTISSDEAILQILEEEPSHSTIKALRIVIDRMEQREMCYMPEDVE